MSQPTGIYNASTCDTNDTSREGKCQMSNGHYTTLKKVLGQAKRQSRAEWIYLNPAIG